MSLDRMAVGDKMSKSRGVGVGDVMIVGALEIVFPFVDDIVSALLGVAEMGGGNETLDRTAVIMSTSIVDAVCCLAIEASSPAAAAAAAAVEGTLLTPKSTLVWEALAVVVD